MNTSLSTLLVAPLSRVIVILFKLYKNVFVLALASQMEAWVQAGADWKG